jgi:hypothetical protein
MTGGDMETGVQINRCVFGMPARQPVLVIQGIWKAYDLGWSPNGSASIPQALTAPAGLNTETGEEPATSDAH